VRPVASGPPVVMAAAVRPGLRKLVIAARREVQWSESIGISMWVFAALHRATC
jgi:hypothetical protein